eukprot:TRINITY_DN4515_c0_g1_i1.p1 TRINITY_DN4515_c0_g1~~TRINITY_DN4515_c0_g1_i1.p1  ORF type:complete len:466 (+),score=35.17 TRINITY_DN4515_c0_g1_i1:116-1513(+)
MLTPAHPTAPAAAAPTLHLGGMQVKKDEVHGVPPRPLHAEEDALAAFARDGAAGGAYRFYGRPLDAFIPGWRDREAEEERRHLALRQQTASAADSDAASSGYYSADAVVPAWAGPPRQVQEGIDRDDASPASASAPSPRSLRSAVRESSQSGTGGLRQRLSPVRKAGAPAAETPPAERPPSATVPSHGPWQGKAAPSGVRGWGRASSNAAVPAAEPCRLGDVVNCRSSGCQPAPAAKSQPSEVRSFGSLPGYGAKISMSPSDIRRMQQQQQQQQRSHPQSPPSAGPTKPSTTEPTTTTLTTTRFTTTTESSPYGTLPRTTGTGQSAYAAPANTLNNTTSLHPSMHASSTALGASQGSYTALGRAGSAANEQAGFKSVAAGGAVAPPASPHEQSSTGPVPMPSAARSLPRKDTPDSRALPHTPGGSAFQTLPEHPSSGGGRATPPRVTPLTPRASVVSMRGGDPVP